MDLAPGIQSALHPRGPDADAIAHLTWVLVGGGTAILLAVLVLAAYALWAPVEHRAWLTKQRFVVGAGIAFPVIHTLFPKARGALSAPRRYWANISR